MFKKRVVSVVMAAAMMVSTICSAGTATVSAASEKAAEGQWQAVAFGQSVDVNFSSTILPEKVGTNNVFEKGTDTKLPAQVPAALQDVTIESRGGKIQAGHDGLTFYYTEVPTSKNFTLTGTVTVEQLGPETGVAGNLQEGCGLMVRDVIGGARQEPLLEGYEEYPAASNIAAIWIDIIAKSKGADLDISALARYGVDEKAGSATAVRKSTRTKWLNDLELRKTTDTEKNTYDATMTLQLERTNESFVMRLLNEDGTVRNEYDFKSLDSNVNANIVENIEGDTMYVGFYCARNARMTVENTSLVLTEADTVDAPKYVPVNKEAAALYQASANYTNSSDYKVQALANFDGTMTVEKDGVAIATGLEVKAGEQFVYPTTLENATTNFKLVFTAADSVQTTGQKEASVSFTVTKEEYAKDLYVSPTGTSTATGTEEDPMDFATAINKLVPGGTIYMAGGTYAATKINLVNSGNASEIKTIIPTGKVVIKDSKVEYLFKLDSDYWNISNIEVDGEERVSSRGFYVSGSNNVIDKLTVHSTKSDAGFCIKQDGRSSRSLWPSNNIVKNTESYNHRDTSGINADGFAAKSGSGDNNKFVNCVSYDNADDGWDLYNTLSGGKNGITIIENCIAYGNGNNGFKLGGESLAVAHEIRNSIAFNNGLDGFTDNFNPGELVVENNTSYDNNRFNYIFRPSPYVKDEAGKMTAAGTFVNNLSYRSSYQDANGNDKYDDKVFGVVKTNNYFIEDSAVNVTKIDFASLNKNNAFYRTEDNALAFGDFLRLSPISKLNYAGKNATHVGALKADSVLVDNITITTENTNLEVDQTTTLVATVEPTIAENKEVTWTSSNTAVAIVDEFGKVTATGAGTAVIKAIAKDGSKVSESIAVTVTEKAVAPVETPSVVEGLKVASKTETSVTLSWTAAKNATGYDVYAYNTATKRYVKVTTVTKTTATINKIAGQAFTEGGKYQFFVRAFNQGTNTTVYAQDSAVVEVQTTVKKPAVVTGLKATTQTTSTIKLSWNKAKDATAYEVYGYDKETKKYVKVTTVTATTATVSKIAGTKLASGTTYKFYVVATRTVNGVKVSAAKSSVLSAVTTPAKVALTVKAGKKQATLSWKKVTGASGYQVYKYNATTKKYEKLKTTSSTILKDTKRKTGSTVKYKVRAYKKVNGTTVFGAFSTAKSAKIK